MLQIYKIRGKYIVVPAGEGDLRKGISSASPYGVQ